MFNLEIKKDDRQWLHANYPTLRTDKDSNECPKIAGLLKIDMVYQEGKPYVIKPEQEHIATGRRIQDEYEIDIIFKSSEHSDLPQVYEKGNRIASVAADRKLRLENLHVNPDGSACLCLNIQENDYLPNGFNLKDFFHILVIPFFYAQSYFEKYKIWPWGQYAHGTLGFFEWYLKLHDVTKEKVNEFIGYLSNRYDWQSLQTYLAPNKKVKGHHACLCNSSEKFRNCHRDVLHGIWKFKQDLIFHQIQL
ncbi:hypothetical protein A3F32_01910 [Candidatus Roizmanbacteria bacterium RIFCSPHIGHO2_12_FULL_42_10]|uniref:Uncharacterized protein n=1 Tax=Candidatus Roizmanbacteria bacterium RIFCSPHIGHO2_12_FULL_42_10 TaxID=1802053 RepID=A0A1F7I683_9BACT|nr:MAG: hypothetical protein A3F32_01910 [Candidatus Roizmanbacteria bacterium RIFCSPHIGHO2_12_FULL_42_10]